MRPCKVIAICLTAVVIELVSSESLAQDYKEYPSKYAVAEINGSDQNSQDQYTAKSFIAAARMAEIGAANKSIDGNVLLSMCQSSTAAGSSWPNSCDFGGLVTAINKYASNNSWGQTWCSGVFPKTEAGKTSALANQVGGLKNFKSPSIVPLAGHADHWGTLYWVKMRVDVNPVKIHQVKFFDAGRAGLDSYGDPLTDGVGSMYRDGIQLIMGEQWESTEYYTIITDVSVNDVYYEKYVLSYDPPQYVRAGSIVAEPSYDWSKAQGLFPESGAMDVHVARDRVWDALLLADVYEQTEIWDAIAKGAAGESFEVNARKPSGEEWSYYLVPIYIDEPENVIAIVTLSADDGAFERIWMPSSSILFRPVSPLDAERIAGAYLRDDEELFGGVLTWDPRVSTPAPVGAILPYYSFYRMSKEGEYRGEVLVTLNQGVVSGGSVSLGRRAEYCEGAAP